MSTIRHEFSQDTIRKLGDRVGWLCSNCRSPTKGPHTNDDKAISVGSACHIHAAAPGGPRYDSSQREEERKSIDNAIWLCRTCGTLVDTDEAKYPAPLLRAWKGKAEADAFERLGRPAGVGMPATVVMSINQQGGQTAHTINNFAPPPRALHGRQMSAELVAKLQARRITQLSIEAYNPDAETIDFARHMWDAATQLGWATKSLPDRVMSPDAFRGILIESAASIRDQLDPLFLFAEWLRRQGFSVEFRAGGPSNLIRVGPRS